MELWFSEFHTPDVKHSMRVDRHLYSHRSEYQQIDIYDTPEFGKVLALDGNVMLTERDEFIYDEMITHVPMAVHPHVQDVLVIGAGDGGVVKELARYECIRSIDLVEMDEQVVEACRRYLPENACRLDDSRVHIYFDNALRFIRRRHAQYDLIIVDSTDPFGPSEGYFTREFYGICYNALRDSCGYKIKLLGRAIREREGKLCAFVAPHLVPASNPLSGVEDVFNAISVTGNAIGDVMFYGRGAGKLPTASAVVADVIDIAKDLKTARCAVWGPGSRDLVVSSDILSSRWYVRGTASMDKVRAAFGEISPLARGGAPAGETAFLTAPMTEPQVRARLEGMELHSLIRVLE